MKPSTEALLNHLATLAQAAAEDALNVRTIAEEGYEKCRRDGTLATLASHTRMVVRYAAEAEAYRILAHRTADQAKALAGIGPACGNSDGRPPITNENRDAIALAEKAVTHRDEATREAYLAEQVAHDAARLFAQRVQKELPE
jgi:hypothetical protein